MAGFKDTFGFGEILEIGSNLCLGHLRIPIPCMQVDHLLMGVAQHLSEALVGLNHLVFLIDDGDAVKTCVHQDTAAQRFFPQRLLRLLAISDVLDEAIIRDEIALSIMVGNRGVAYPSDEVVLS